MGAKAVQALLLANLIVCSNGGRFGPGALSAVLSLVQLAQGKGWQSVYKRKASDASSEARNVLGDFDEDAFVNRLMAVFRIVVVAYCKARVKSNRALAPVLEHAQHILDRNHPFDLFEHMLCEFLRRRAAGLAWAKGILSKLPKGRFSFKRYLANAKYRTGANMYFLVLNDGGAMIALPLNELRPMRK